MTISIVARRYATALFESVHPRASTIVRQELRLLADVLMRTPELRRFLTAPGITPAAQVQFLERQLATLVSADTLAFLRLLVTKRRTEELPGILAYFEELFYAATQIKRVTIRSARPLPAELRETIKRKLGAWIKEQVELECEVDPGLLGGLQIFVAHQVVDGSLRHRLSELRTRLRSVKVH
ncbi:MAG: ATP synthase F1 subunit delta [Candidatus Omnitrophica bacterium]|nr:ATP synthase F1 subunit delta [Candidatus Omnitrophota bacterium]